MLIVIPHIEKMKKKNKRNFPWLTYPKLPPHPAHPLTFSHITFFIYYMAHNTAYKHLHNLFAYLYTIWFCMQCKPCEKDTVCLIPLSTSKT